MTTVTPGDYRHYKGRHYRVLGVARHSETEEELVVYRQLYGDFALWVRPAAMFAETVSVGESDVPRFAPLDAPHRPRLTPEQHAHARAFVMTHGRALERARYAHAHGSGSAEDVLAELSRFQNDDGGFGHGLEPDLQTPQSSVLATTVALQIARSVAAPASHPTVRRAMAYLAAQYDADHGYWPIIPPHVDDAPHAPWWQSGAALPEHAARYVFNPGAEVVAYLWSYPEQTPLDVRRARLEQVLSALDARADATNADGVEMHELLCLLRLLETPALPSDARERLTARLRPVVPRLVSTDPGAWRGYGLRPLDVAPTPASPFAAQMGDALELDLTYLIEQQAEDGAWHPAWSWGDAYADVWPAAAQAWSGVLTVNALATLAAFDRVQPIAAAPSASTGAAS